MDNHKKTTWVQTKVEGLFVLRFFQIQQGKVGRLPTKCQKICRRKTPCHQHQTTRAFTQNYGSFSCFLLYGWRKPRTVF